MKVRPVLLLFLFARLLVFKSFRQTDKGTDSTFRLNFKNREVCLIGSKILLALQPSHIECLNPEWPHWREFNKRRFKTSRPLQSVALKIEILPILIERC